MNNNIKSIVCTTGNRMVKEGYTRSEAFKEAWAMVKRELAAVPEQKEADQEITVQVMEYKKLQAMIEELETKAEELKKSITSVMEERQIEELKTDVFKVRYITVISNRFNTVEFKKTNEELYNQFLKENVTKRFTIV